MTLIEQAKATALGAAQAMLHENLGKSPVGAGITKDLVVDGKRYLVNVDAFWEKSKHYDFLVLSPQGEVIHREKCVPFDWKLTTPPEGEKG